MKKPIFQLIVIVVALLFIAACLIIWRVAGRPANSASSPPGDTQADTPLLGSEFVLMPTVRLAGTTGWSDALTVNPGDVVEIQFEYRNTSKSEAIQSDVAIQGRLPEGFEFVDGSLRLWNASNPDGVPVSDASIFFDGNSEVINHGAGLNIGSYHVGANAFIRYQAKAVNPNPASAAWGYVSVGGTLIQESASVALAE